jgi:hypothetical protein
MIERDRDRYEQRGKVRPAARRETSRPGESVPRSNERALLRRGDRTVLGAMKRESPTSSTQTIIPTDIAIPTTTERKCGRNAATAGMISAA